MTQSLQDKTERWTRPLRAHLSVVTMLLLIGVSAPLIWLSYERGQEAAVISAGGEMGTQSDRIVDRYRALFSDAQSSLGIVSSVQDFLTSPPQAIEAKTEVLVAALEETTYLNGIYAGYPDGTFIHAVELANDPAWREVLKAPKEAAFALRINLPGQDGMFVSNWRFLDADHRTIAATPSAPTSYDPRKRVWYRLAREKHRPVVSPPYVYATTKALGLTISEPHRDNPQIIIGADLILGRLSQFLADEKISPGATSYVFDHNRDLLVQSDPKVMAVLLSQLDSGSVDQAALAKLDTLYGPVRAMVEGTPDRIGQSEIIVGGRPYFVNIARIQDNSLLDGTAIVVAAPASDFTGESERLLRTGVSVSLVLLAIGVFIAFLTSRLVSRSLTQLTSEAAKLSELDFTDYALLPTRVTEIRALNRAIDAARDTIRAFALYVPKELVRKIVSAGQQEARRGARQDVTILFTDIKDFTTICEHNTPEAVVAMLSRYFEIANQGVERHQGAITQFLGDGVNAMWNAPVRVRDHAAKACACALDLKDAFDQFNAEQRQRGEPELITRFGLHTGPALVGSVGAAERLQYTAMGDTVNVASRLEGINKEYGTTILTSHAVYQRCKDRFDFRPLGEAKAKGREEAVEVFELTGRRA